jgi:hypothetical protein
MILFDYFFFQNTRDILKHLDNLEGEIISQKEYSDALLNKIKIKFTSTTEASNNKPPQKSRNSKELIGKGVGDKKGLLESSDKLIALQKELQQEAHIGEVRSDLEIGDDNGTKKKDEFANGEVIDDMMENNTNNKKKTPAYSYSDEDSVIAVLVFVCDRPSIKRSLDKLFKYRPSEKKFPIVVSQDCGSHPATTQVLQSYNDRIIHIKQPDLSEINVPPKEKKMKGYYNIARHYGKICQNNNNTNHTSSSSSYIYLQDGP